MNRVRRLLLLGTLAICLRPYLAVCEPPTPKYAPGYDPLKTHRHQVRTLPDDAWGAAVNGLQAAISAPDKIRLNEVVTGYLVLRNVSEKTIRISLPQHPDVLHLRRDGTTISYTVNKDSGPVSFWELKPGHQTLVPSPPIQIPAPGHLGLKHGLTNLTPGPHTIYAGIGSGGHRWIPTGDGTSRKYFPAEGEWTGWLTAARRPIEVLAEEVPFEISPLEVLPAGHGLQHVLGMPPSLNRGTTEWIRFPDGREFALDSSQDAHWLLDSVTYNQLVCWGPIPAARLKELKLLDQIRQLSHQYIQTADHDSQIEWRIGVLVRSQQPLAEMGLNFVPTMPKPKPPVYFPSDDLVRTIRDRRVELNDMGLAIPMQRALDLLTANDPPMPDDAQFKVISNKEMPPGLKDEAWGPKNAGLQAAALMPDSITAEATETVRLFIRNVSDRDVRLAASQRAGYDYATAVDDEGNRLTTVRPYVYPGAFSSVITPELNPGQQAQHPPTATLQYFLLKPGAVLELGPKTALSYHLLDSGTGSFLGLTQEDGKPAVTHISAKPTAARVTWHLHAANGAAYSNDLKRRVWPAKGAWSGILTTAPTLIHLRP